MSYFEFLEIINAQTARLVIQDGRAGAWESFFAFDARQSTGSLELTSPRSSR